MQNTWWKKWQLEQLTEDVAQDRMGTPPDWGGSDGVAMSGAEGLAEEQPGSIRHDPMLPSTTQEPVIPGASLGKTSGAEGPVSSTFTLTENPNAPPRELSLE